jgi:hypothetical protein
MLGGIRKGAGRKPSPTPRSKTLNIRLTDAEHKQILALGGSAWVRTVLDMEARPAIHISETPIQSVELTFNAKAIKMKNELIEELLMDAITCINSALLDQQYPNGL